MRKLVTPITYTLDAPGAKEPKTTKPSETVPNEALSIREILDRYARRQPLFASNRQGIYSENPDIEDDDMEKLGDADIGDRYQVLEALRESGKELAAKAQAEKIEAEKAAVEAAKKAKKKEEAIEAFIASQSNSEPNPGQAGKSAV